MRTLLGALVGGLLLVASAGAGSAEDEFPFDSELIMDVDPMPGSRRIPNMDVDSRGGIVMEMWCNRMQGQFVVAGGTLTVLTGPTTQRDCPPARQRADDELLAALAGVTGWRREGSVVTLIGAPALRFRLPSN